MMAGTRLGIYVGSFNPPHIGHLSIAQHVLKKGIVDKVLILPTPNYWDKTNLVSIEHRVNMLKFFEDENIIIDDVHNKEPYTYQVLESIKKDYPDNLLYLIIGSDNLEKLHEWKNIDEILKNNIIVIKRGNIIKNKNLENYDNKFIYCEDFDMPISSTDIRNNKKEGLLPGIKEYIEKNHLYEDD